MNLLDKLFETVWTDDITEVDVGKAVVVFRDITNGETYEYTLKGYIICCAEHVWVRKVRGLMYDTIEGRSGGRAIKVDDGTYIYHTSGRYTAKIKNIDSYILRYQRGYHKFFGIKGDTTYRRL